MAAHTSCRWLHGLGVSREEDTLVPAATHHPVLPMTRVTLLVYTLSLLLSATRSTGREAIFLVLYYPKSLIVSVLNSYTVSGNSTDFYGASCGLSSRLRNKVHGAKMNASMPYGRDKPPIPILICGSTVCRQAFSVNDWNLAQAGSFLVRRRANWL
jgi:hypothetical protein